jgi:hypothetical protein
MPTVRQLWKPVLVLAASFMLFVFALVLPFAQVGISAAPPSAALIPASASLARSSGPQARLGADIPFSLMHLIAVPIGISFQAQMWALTAAISPQLLLCRPATYGLWVIMVLSSTKR